MLTEDDTFKALCNPNYRNAAFVANMYAKARIRKGHHQYETLCKTYGLSIEELKQYQQGKQNEMHKY